MRCLPQHCKRLSAELLLLIKTVVASVIMKTTSVFVLPASYLECRQESWFRRQVLKAQEIASTPASLLYRFGPILKRLAT